MSGIFKILKHGKKSARHLGLPDETIEIDATDINYVFSFVDSIERIADSIAKKDKKEQRKEVTKEEYLDALNRLCSKLFDASVALRSGKGFSAEMIDRSLKSLEHEFDVQLATLAAMYFDEERGGGT